MRVGLKGDRTDTGRRRRHNEDSFVVRPPWFAVADGMGGAQAGELASQLAISVLDEDPAEGATGQDRVTLLIQDANRRVYERSRADSAVSGMGTTMTVALVEEGVVWIGHVGDSRAYLIRDGQIEQLTDDHSLVAEMMRSGKLSPEEAEVHPQRSVITRALGTEADVDVDAFAVETRPGDVFMLCSDGLTTMVADEAIAAIVEDNRSDLDAAARALVKAANRRGGDDNITVVLFDITDEPAGAAQDAPTLVDLAPVEDEDTLDELDAVPPVRVEAVDTMVVSVDDLRSDEGYRQAEDDWLAQAAADAPRPRLQRRRREGGSSRRLLWFAAGFLLLVIVAALIVWGLSRAHFVGAAKDGRVAVYQGVPWDLVGNVRLYRPVYVSDRLQSYYLSPAERRSLFDHDLHSRAAALRLVHRLERDVVS